MTALNFSATSTSTTRTKDCGKTPNMLTGNKVELLFGKLGERSNRYALSTHDKALIELSGELKVGGQKCVMSSTGTYTIIIGDIEHILFYPQCSLLFPTGFLMFTLVTKFVPII